MHVRYIGPFAAQTGYAEAAHGYMMSLLAAGISLEIDPINPDTGVLHARYAKLGDLVTDVTKLVTHTIVHCPPQYAHEFLDDLDPESKRILITTWETTKLPSIKLINEWDRIVVPSTFNHRTFIDSGIDHDLITVIPHAADEHWWCTHLSQPPDNTYTFYAIDTWCDRKNPIGLLTAYLTEFTSADRVNLRWRTTPTVNDIVGLKRALKLDDYPNIDFIIKSLTDEELRELHRTSHCYVTASHGEGWGLGAFEATLLGNHVITPEFGGVMDFVNNNSSLIKYHLTPCHTLADKDAPEIGYTGDQYWAELDIMHLRRAMREAYTTWKSYQPVKFPSRFGYKAVGELFKQRVLT